MFVSLLYNSKQVYDLHRCRSSSSRKMYMRSLTCATILVGAAHLKVKQALTTARALTQKTWKRSMNWTHFVFQLTEQVSTIVEVWVSES